MNLEPGTRNLEPGARMRLQYSPMVGVAQSVEHRVVAPGVAGSSPVAHPYTSHEPSRPW